MSTYFYGFLSLACGATAFTFDGQIESALVGAQIAFLITQFCEL